MAARPTTPLTAGQAVAAIASQAVFGDGSVTAEEVEMLKARLGGFTQLWTAESVDAAMKVVGERMRHQGVDAVLTEAVATVPRHLQQPLLGTVRDLVQSDGSASADEDELVARLNAAYAPKGPMAGRP